MTMTKPRRSPLKLFEETWDEYFGRLREFFDLDIDSGEYKEGMTELEARVRVWKLGKESRMPGPTQVFAAHENVRQSVCSRSLSE